MGDDDLFLAALAAELEATQRALPSSCLFCVPQARSLVADARVSQEMLFAHVLAPADSSSSSSASSSSASSSSIVHHPGAYETLNGKSVAVAGSHVFTGKGFDEKRKVRVLLSEYREVQNQQVLVLHVSRPLVGGVAVPEDPNEIDVATFRRYTAMLRAFPENELVFLHLDETIAQARKICRQNQFANRYEATLPQILREEWGFAVDEIARGGSLAESDDEDSSRTHTSVSSRRPFASTAASHFLQIQQVVECYLMEQLHKVIFPRVMVSCRDDDEKLAGVLRQMRHYGPADFGLRKEFQCYLLAARDAIVKVERKKTPLEMLLAFKTCIDHINDSVTRNLRRHHHSLDGFQLTTDDILDELLYVLLQAYNLAAAEAAAQDEREQPHFPMVSVLKYVSDYHFINSNTSMLGYTIANFQVAVEYFLLKATHAQSCRVCYNIGSRRRAAWNSWDDAVEEQCPQAIVPSAIQAAFTRNYTAWLAVKEQRTSRPPCEDTSGQNGVTEDTPQRLVILGDWSPDDDSAVEGPPSSVHDVVMQATTATATSTVTQISCGHRFFAIANDQGELLTWGDQSGSRLGYPAVQGDPRRVMVPRVVPALQGLHVLQVSCGAFHTLVTDINGHVFAWGQNARGQLGFLTHALDTTTVETPTLVNDLKGVYVSSVACGEYHSLGMSSDGRVFSWGCNKFTKLGRPTEGLLDAVQPKSVQSSWAVQSIGRVRRRDDDDNTGLPVGAVRRIAAGRDHSAAVTFDGAVFTWGRGDQGQLGHGARMDVPEPKQVIALADDAGAMRVMDVSAGGNLTLMLLRDGSVFITGHDPSRPEQDDTTSGTVTATAADLLTPELITFEATSEKCVSFVAVAAGDAHFALVSDRGDVIQSRRPDELQDANDAPESTPKGKDSRRLERVSSVQRAVRVRAGASHTLVLCAGG